MFTLEENWISALRELCPLFLWHLTQSGRADLYPSYHFVCFICWYIFIITILYMFKTHIPLWTSAHMQMCTVI